MLQLARDAERAGTAGLVLTPFSYLAALGSGSPDVLAQVSAATALPLGFYNKPIQTQHDVSPGTLAHFASHTAAVAIKDSMRREVVGVPVAQLREAVGQNFVLGLSSDVHLLEAQSSCVGLVSN